MNSLAQFFTTHISLKHPPVKVKTMMTADWSQLPQPLLELIYRRLFPSDHLGFSSVCSSWRLVAIEEGRYLPHQFVGLIASGVTMDSETRRLFEPLQCDYKNSNRAPLNLSVPHRYYCCGASFGWLVLVDESLDMQLLDPISGEKIQLPSSTTLPPSRPSFRNFGKYSVSKAILSCAPSRSTSYRTIVLTICGGLRLAYCKPGDEAWTSIEFEVPREHVDAIYYKGKFFAVYNPGGIVTIDFADPDHPTMTDYAPTPPGEFFWQSRYLVESKGELFQLRRTCKFDSDNTYRSDSDDYDYFFGVAGGDGEEVLGGQSQNDDDYNDEVDNESDQSDESDGSDLLESLRCYRTVRFKVFKFRNCPGCNNLEAWQKVESIGDNAFFVGGCNSSFSVSVSDFLGCKPNSIYFTDSMVPYDYMPEPIRHDIGIFSLEDKSVKEIYPIDSKPVWPPSFWFTPVPWRN
ncbi:hypothetical protein IFM89_025248 [Coptis chinensis]|uniref:F-box domain-containing protein n=1 Tax=Coptis chinensis TaxID=261450 RepID=A0A835LWH1_9MAGN|nr:hypothetical protein IFM89_025248 [Coptis chinensis]